jgi:hypothetical protein
MSVLRDTLQQITATQDLIREEGQPIALMRMPAPVGDGAGGYVQLSYPEDAVTQAAVKRFFSRSEYEPLAGSDSSQGEGVHQKFILIGMPGDSIKVDDFFTIDGIRYVVNFIHDDTSYQVKAEGVASYGG